MKNLALIALLVLFTALHLGCTNNQTSSSEQSSAGHHMQHMDGKTPAEWALRQDMRKLWTDHVVWTRNYIIAAVADTPDQQAASKRLLKNQEDIGDAVAAYYGKPAGDQLTTLLKEHITISVDLIKAAKAQDKDRFGEINRKWEQNGEEIAAFLGKANPNWSRATLSDMMKQHLSTTINEVQARLDKNWDRDVKAFDEVYDHILKMSDALSDGIIKQFPDKFGGNAKVASR